jgi:hypothetical protein
MKLRIGGVAVTFLLFVLSLAAQTASSGSTSSSSQVPPLIPFSSVATDQGGSSLSGVVNVTFSLYNNQQGGEALWSETQNNVQLDATGHYSVQLGITKPNGVPTTLFTSTEARWLGVQIAGQGEQPRVLLLSVPYALKAGDAATIGGLPPSAFVLAAPQNGAASVYVAGSSTEQSVSPATATDVTTTGGTADYLPIFSGADTIIDSVLFQSGSGTTARLGIGTITPATTLDVKGAGTIRGALNLPSTATATATAGANSQPLTLAASAYNSSTPAAVHETFQLQAEPASNDTATPSATLNLLFGAGTTKPSETGLHIASNGQITFATGQTFPGAGGGTLTGITTATGSGLIGGGTSGTLKLGLLTTCSNGQVLEWNGTAWACAAAGTGTITGVTAGTDLTGGGTSGNVTLSLNTTATNAMYAQLGAANTFTGNETVNGLFTANTSSSTAAVTGNGASIGVTGNGSPIGLGVLGSGAVGVVGESNAADGAGVNGENTATTGAAIGVAGASESPAGYGVSGFNSSTTGTAFGVYGSTFSSAGVGVEGSVGSPNSVGVEGTNTATSGNAVGVYGTSAVGFGVEGSVASPTGYGVYGQNYVTSGTTAGVYGDTASPTGYGVEGDNYSGSGMAPGVYGTSASAGGYGVYGAGTYGVYGNDTSANGLNYGVVGTSPDGTGVYGGGGVGVTGSGVSTGVYAIGEFGVDAAGDLVGAAGFAQGNSATGEEVDLDAGVWGDTEGTLGEFVGVLASADTNTALVAANTDSTGDYPSMVVENYTTATHNPVFQTSSPNTYSGSRHCTIDTSANLTCTGVVSGVVQQVDGTQTAIYAMQSAENWLEDAGSGQLSNGSVRIELDSAFAQTVNAGIEYHVFLTPNGDSRGLYVSHKTATSFEVHEQGGGASSIAFDYRIMAKRKGYESVRLEDVTERFKQHAVAPHKARVPRALLPQARPNPAPAIATPPMRPMVAPRPMPAAPKLPPMPALRAAQASKPELNQK